MRVRGCDRSVRLLDFLRLNQRRPREHVDWRRTELRPHLLSDTLEEIKPKSENHSKRLCNLRAEDYDYMFCRFVEHGPANTTCPEQFRHHLAAQKNLFIAELRRKKNRQGIAWMRKCINRRQDRLQMTTMSASMPAIIETRKNNMCEYVATCRG